MQAIPISLYQYGPHELWKGIPTFDPSCLKIQTYMRFVGVPFIEVNCNNPKLSPDNTLPVMVVQKDKIVLKHDIIPSLSDLGYGPIDKPFEKGEVLADIVAYKYMIESSLYAYQLYNWFGEEDNNSTSVEGYSSSDTPFPMNWILPYRLKTKIAKQLEHLKLINKMEVYQQAQELLEMISSQLDKKPYLFGDNPSSADVAAYSILATQYYSNFEEDKLTSILKRIPNLIAYVERITDKYFTRGYTTYEQPFLDWLAKSNE